MVETDVAYPTDVKLLYDAVRKSVDRSARAYDLVGWRQCASLKSKLTEAFQSVRVAKRYKVHPDRVLSYLDRCSMLLAKCVKTRDAVASLDRKSSWLAALEAAHREAWRHFELVWRRLVDQEKIPHHEKVFSLHAPHTRWMAKGKAGVPVELGVPLAIVESHEGLIPDWEIMWHTVDVDVAVPLAERCKRSYRTHIQISYDRGFWSPENFEALKSLIELPALPKKGKPNKKDCAMSAR